MEGLESAAGEALPAGLDPRLAERAYRAAAWVRAQRDAQRTVTVVHHIDADGVTSGAIAAQACHRAGVACRMLAVKSLDHVHLDMIRAAGPQALWFCDLGSTAYMHFPDTPRLVCDHHQLVRDGAEESFPHVNPLLDGLPGESISGAGCAYLVAAALDAQNVDLLPLALVGASADLQDRPRAGSNGFHGANAALLRHGSARGLVEAKLELGWFGPHTRSLDKFLHLGRDPAVPGVSGDRSGARQLALDAGCDPDKPYAQQDELPRRRLRTLLAERLLDCGLAAQVPALFRTVVTLAHEPADAPTRELQEYGTLLNSTARYGQPDIGLAVARGDRAEAYRAALELLQGHRRHLVGALESFARHPVRSGTCVQWVHLEADVLDTVVGIVAGMALEAMALRRDQVLVAFAHTPDGRTKASARSPHELVTRGADLATAMREAAERVGGQGGGHKGAAGATIPRGAEGPFIAILEGLFGAQLGVRPAPADPAGASLRPAGGVPANALSAARVVMT